MSAPTPFALELLLQTVADACVAEITAMRHELATERAAAAAARLDLEVSVERERARAVEAEAHLNAARLSLKLLADQGREDGLKIAKLEGALAAARETAKASKVSTTSQVRQPDRESVKPAPEATNEGAKPEPRPPSLPLSPPRATVEKAEVIPPAPRKGPPDLTGASVGDFGAGEKTTGRDGLGRILWRFTCVHGCGKFRIWSVQVVATMRNRRQAPKCQCQGGSPPYAHSTGRVPVAAAPALPVPNVAKAWSGRGRPPEQVRRQREREAFESAGARVDGPTSAGDHMLDGKLDELDTSVGDDLDGLLSRAMAEADGDSFIRRGAGGPAPRRPEREADDDQEDGEREPTEARDEDADDESAEELDFE